LIRRIMLSLSTALRSEVSGNGEEIIREILSYGIQAVELEYRVTESMLEEILPFVKKRDILITSIHNIMPLPEGMSRQTANGEFVSLSSPDRSEREMAVKYARRTLEWAEETGAQAVVLHLGKVLMESPMRALRDLYDRKKIATDEGRAVLAEMMELRRRKEEGKYLAAALQSLEKLALEAERRRIFLGIENRYNLQDFPNLEELKEIFKEFKDSPVRYWHDLGHSTTQENLGLVGRGELLNQFGRYLIGVHLHGCRGYEDHAAPGSGEEDYSQLKKFLKTDTVKVVETHHRTTRAELKKGLEFLRSQGID
jgi:sugar phosphate isomerase/epimerase